MSNETKTNRTQLTDLPVAEQEMTIEEMENVQGGFKYTYLPSDPAPPLEKIPDEKDPPLQITIIKPKK